MASRDGHMILTLKDAASHTVQIKIEMTPDALMKALTGLSYLPCRFTLLATELAGKIQETRIVSVILQKGYYNDAEFATMTRRLAKHHEVEGWEIDDYSLKMNHHRIERLKDGTALFSGIVLRRYINAE